MSLFANSGIQRKKNSNDDTAKQVRGNLNINNRDNYVWNKVNERHLMADVKQLEKFISTFSLP